MHARRFLFAGTFAFVTLSLLVGVAAADTWPRFHGPNGTGIATNQNIPAKWEKEHILWKVPVPGDGNSSPIVWNDFLFLQSANKKATERLLICLNAKTGQMVWTKSVDGASAAKHVKNTFASSTPATDGERVYACFWDGAHVHMFAYDFSGNKVWSRDLGSFTSQHGAGASPIVHKDKVILLNDQDNGASLIALNAKTGEPAWEAKRPYYRACYGSPFLWEKNGQSELVVVTTKQITGYDPDNGQENWHWTWEHTTKMPLRVTGSPTFDGKTIFACSGDGGGDRGMIALEVSGAGKGATGKLAWSNAKDFPYVPSLLCHEKHLYFVNDLGMAGCYECKNGAKNWFKRITDAAFTASPVLIDGKMYAADEAGDVYVLTATPQFEFLARNPLGERVRATPAVANQRLYIRGKDHLFCIGQGK